MRSSAIEAMTPFLADHAANPSGSHRGSQAAKTALEEARERVAALLGAAPSEIVFTGGGSEGDNLAIKGAAWAAADRDGELGGIVTTGIEHKAVLGAVDRLRRAGATTHVVPATRAGTLDLDRLAAALDEHTTVVSVMLVNNETGIVQPLDEVAALVRDRAPRAVLHTDAVQAPQWLDVGAVARNADLVAVSGHKFGGPKGVGALVRRKNIPLVPLVEGGGHEWGLRAGTQNVAGIVAFATAFAETHETRETEIARIAALRGRLEAGLRSQISDMVVNGDTRRRVAGLLHVAFPGVEAEILLVALDQMGIEAASGSACSSGAIDPSHVLVAMGLDDAVARASVRFSLGYASTDADVDAALDAVPRAVASLRAASTV